MEKENTKSLIQFIKSKNIDTFGVIEAGEFNNIEEFYNYRKENDLFNEFEEQDIKKKISPFIYMEDAKSIISFAFPYLYNNEDSFNKVYFSKYTRGEDYHKVVKSCLSDICAFIESLGYKAIHLVDSNSLPERYIANEARIGFIGKNNLLITKKYGSYVFLAEIITNMDIDTKGKILSTEKSYPQNICDYCNKCVKVCPAGALKDDIKDNDFNKCLSYLSQKKDLSKGDLESLKGRIFGCDSCQDICPLNKGVDLSKIEQFIPMDFMDKVDALMIVNATKKEFKEKYMVTSCGWRGKNVIQRNALSALSYEGRLHLVDESSIASKYLKSYYMKLKENEN